MQCTSSWLQRFNLLLLRLHGVISLSLLCLHSSWGSALDLAPPLHVGRPLVPVLHPDKSGLKERLIVSSGSLRPGWGRGTECGASLRQQRPTWLCNSLRCAMCSPGEVVPGSWDPGNGGLHRLPGGEVWIVTCACTQDSWLLQQQH